MGLLGDALEDVGNVLEDVGDTVDDTLSVDIPAVVEDVGGVISDAGALVTDALTNVGDVLGKILAIPTPTVTLTVDPPKPTTTPTTTTQHTTRPPSNTSPTSQLPTSQPPTSQPPTSQPPVSQPPASQPPSSSPPNSGQPAPTEPGGQQSSETSPGGSDSTETAGDWETGSTTGRPPSATGAVGPNPVALPHQPGPGEDDGNGDGSISPGTGNGSGGNGDGNDNVSGNGTGGPSGGRPGGSLSDDDSDGSLGSGAIAAIVIVAAILTLIVLVCLVRRCFIRRRRAKRSAWAKQAAEDEKRVASWVGGPTAVTPRHSIDSGSGTLESYHSGSTHDSSLFTGPPPVPSWSPASATQQRRMLRLGNDSDSNENFGQPVDHSQISWSALRSPLTDMVYAPAIPASVYVTNHRNTHISDDSTSLSSPVRENASHTHSSVVPTPHHSTTELSAMGTPRSEEGSPRQSESYGSDLAYARPVSVQLPGHFSTPNPTTESGSGSRTPSMAQVQSSPVNIPAHMIVPSQMPASTSISVPPPVLVPSQPRVVLSSLQGTAHTPSPLWISPEGWGSPVWTTQSPPPPRSTATLSPLWMAPADWGSPTPRIASPPRSPISPVHFYPRPPIPPPVQPRTTSELFMDEDPFASPLDRADRA